MILWKSFQLDKYANLHTTFRIITLLHFVLQSEILMEKRDTSSSRLSSLQLHFVIVNTKIWNKSERRIRGKVF